MERIYTNVKSQLGPGPWQHEPDKVQWVDQETGLDCLAVRNPVGTWCGYVGIPKGHGAYDAPSYDAIPVEVHGGLTYGPSPCMVYDPKRWNSKADFEAQAICHVPFEGRSDDIHWVGFDCAHSLDLIPEKLAYEKLGVKFPHDYYLVDDAGTVHFKTDDCSKLPTEASAYEGRTLKQTMPNAGLGGWDDTYRTLAYVKAECASLAKQLTSPV